jgi:ABC-type antimicrobial peptide transport system permease subunit
VRREIIADRQGESFASTRRAVVAKGKPGVPPPNPPRPTNVRLEWPSTGPSAFVLQGILAGAALLFTLFVVAVSLALAAAETRDERDVLTVVGAAPSVMRRASGHKAALLAGLGALLAIPVGFLPVVVFTRADPSNLPLVFPWRIAAILVVVVPLVAALVTTAGSAIVLWRRPVRISTMAFD